MSGGGLVCVNSGLHLRITWDRRTQLLPTTIPPLPLLLPTTCLPALSLPTPSAYLCHTTYPVSQVAFAFLLRSLPPSNTRSDLPVLCCSSVLRLGGTLYGTLGFNMACGAGVRATETPCFSGLFCCHLNRRAPVCGPYGWRRTGSLCCAHTPLRALPHRTGAQRRNIARSRCTAAAFSATCHRKRTRRIVCARAALPRLYTRAISLPPLLLHAPYLKRARTCCTLSGVRHTGSLRFAILPIPHAPAHAVLRLNMAWHGMAGLFGWDWFTQQHDTHAARARSGAACCLFVCRLFGLFTAISSLCLLLPLSLLPPWHT